MQLTRSLVRVISDPKVFSDTILLLQLASAVRWSLFRDRNLQQAVYWLAASLLVYAVTYLKGPNGH